MNRGYRGRSSERGPSSSYSTGRPIANLAPHHGQAFTTEKERMSVFDRLGTRRGLSSGSGGSGPNYPEFTSPGKKTLTSSVVPVHRSVHEDERMAYHGSRYDQDKYPSYSQTSRTRTPSPSYQRRPEGMANPGENRRHAEKLERHIQMEHGSLPKSKQKDGRPKDTHKSKQKVHSTSKPKKLSKQKTKGIGSSSETSSSTSKSESSSSSVSSESNSDSDSSESSTPSIKIKTRKSRRIPEDQTREKHPTELQSNRKPVGSSSSSIISTPTKYEGHKNREIDMDRNESFYLRGREREYPKDRDYDRQNYLPHKPREYPHPREPPGSIEHEKDRPHYSRQAPVEQPSRKRQHSVESYGSGGKRNRHYTPTPDRYKTASSRHSPGARRVVSPESFHEKKRFAPDSSRRITPTEMYDTKLSRRERTPPPERMRIVKPIEKQPYYAEGHRREDRYEDRSRDTRAHQFSPLAIDSYGSKERRPPRERLAPARSSPPMRGRAAPPAPQQNFETPGIGRRAPLLPFPSGVEAQSQRFGYQQGPPRRDFSSPARSRGAGSSQGQMRKQEHLETRVKDFEQGGRQSRVDSWVDETVGKEPIRPPLLPTPTYAPYKHPPAVRTEVASSRTPMKKEVSIVSNDSTKIDSEKKVESVLKTEELEEVLSDISDEAEEILNESHANDAPKDTPAEINATFKEPEPDNTNATNLPVDSKATTEESTTADVKNKPPNEVDVLEEFDLEEISDDELGEPERKTGIVDALGVDWSSLISTQKVKNEPTENVEEKVKKIGLRDKWSPANRFKLAGLPRSLFGDAFFNKIYAEIQKAEESDGLKPEERTTEEELEFPSLRHRKLERRDFMRNFEVMSSTSAYTRQRDEVLRRFVRELPPAPMGGFLEVPVPIPSVEEEDETDLDIFHKSVALLKETMAKC